MSAVESVESVRVELDREKQALLEAQGETASAEAELAYQEEQVRHLKIDVANAKALYDEMIKTATERDKAIAGIQQQMHQSQSLHRQAVTAKRAELLKMKSELVATVYIRADETAIAAETKRLANVLADLKENGGASETEIDMETETETTSG